MVTDLDDAYENAQFELSIKARQLTQDAPEGYTVHARLLDGQQNAIVEQEFPVTFGSDVDEKGHAVCTMDYEQTILSPKLWSAEKPNLYTLVLELCDETGASVEFASSRIGFREVELRDNTGPVCQWQKCHHEGL